MITESHSIAARDLPSGILGGGTGKRAAIAGVGVEVSSAWRRILLTLVTILCCFAGAEYGDLA